MADARKPLPSESAICVRVAAYRRFDGRSQEEFAEAIGLTRDQLANIENGRTELRFWQGWKVCKAMNLNQRFLATGQAPERPFHDFDPENAIARPIPLGASFGAVCSTWLAKELQFRNELLEKSTGKGTSGAFSIQYEEAVIQVAKAYLKQAPESERGIVFEHLCDSIRAAVLPTKTQLAVDNKSSHDKTPGVQVFRNYGQLLNRLREITKPRGAKAALARQFNVSRQAVDKWLSGESKPSADIAIELQHWKPDQPKK